MSGNGLLNVDQLDYYRAYGHAVADMKCGQIIGDLLGHIDALVRQYQEAEAVAKVMEE